jgi:hypothetical protein
MNKLLDSILGGLENLLPHTMQVIYKLYMYLWFKSIGYSIMKDEKSAKDILTKED